MKSPAECRAYAEQCRQLAKGMGKQHSEQTLEMADIWETLARESEEATARRIRRAEISASRKAS